MLIRGMSTTLLLIHLMAHVMLVKRYKKMMGLGVAREFRGPTYMSKAHNGHKCLLASAVILIFYYLTIFLKKIYVWLPERIKLIFRPRG